jgi:osmotically-inducible protein OsmY
MRRRLRNEGGWIKTEEHPMKNVISVVLGVGCVAFLGLGGPFGPGAAPIPPTQGTTDIQIPALTVCSASLAERSQEFLEDSRILIAAKAMLFDQKALQSKYLRVRVSKQVVFLDGFVRDREEEAFARKKLAEIRGVRRVVAACASIAGLGKKPEYETKVSGPAEDMLVAAKVRAAILRACADKTLPWEIHTVAVDVFKGDTQVYVVVPQPELADKISAIARAVNGVANSQVKACLPARELELEK